MIERKLVSEKHEVTDGDLKIFVKWCPKSKKVTFKTKDHGEDFRFINSDPAKAERVLRMMVDALKKIRFANQASALPFMSEIRSIPHKPRMGIRDRLVELKRVYRGERGTNPDSVILAYLDWQELVSWAQEDEGNGLSDYASRLKTRPRQCTVLGCQILGISHTGTTVFSGRSASVCDTAAVINSDWNIPYEFKKAFDDARARYADLTRGALPYLRLTAKDADRLYSGIIANYPIDTAGKHKLWCDIFAGRNDIYGGDRSDRAAVIVYYLDLDPKLILSVDADTSVVCGEKQ